MDDLLDELDDDNENPLQRIVQSRTASKRRKEQTDLDDLFAAAARDKRREKAMVKKLEEEEKKHIAAMADIKHQNLETERITKEHERRKQEEAEQLAHAESQLLSSKAVSFKVWSSSSALPKPLVRVQSGSGAEPRGLSQWNDLVTSPRNDSTDAALAAWLQPYVRQAQVPSASLDTPEWVMRAVLQLCVFGDNGAVSSLAFGIFRAFVAGESLDLSLNASQLHLFDRPTEAQSTATDCWVPTFQDFVQLFGSLGVPLEAHRHPSDASGGKQHAHLGASAAHSGSAGVPTVEPTARELHSVKQLLDILSTCLRFRPAAYTTEQMQQLLPAVLCCLIDPTLRSLVVHLESCLSALVSCHEHSIVKLGAAERDSQLWRLVQGFWGCEFLQEPCRQHVDLLGILPPTGNGSRLRTMGSAALCSRILARVSSLNAESVSKKRKLERSESSSEFGASREKKENVDADASAHSSFQESNGAPPATHDSIVQLLKSLASATNDVTHEHMNEMYALCTLAVELSGLAVTHAAVALSDSATPLEDYVEALTPFLRTSRKHILGSKLASVAMLLTGQFKLWQ